MFTGVFWQQHIVCYSNVLHHERTYITNFTLTVCTGVFWQQHILCYSNIVHTERTYQITAKHFLQFFTPCSLNQSNTQTQLHIPLQQIVFSLCKSPNTNKVPTLTFCYILFSCNTALVFSIPDALNLIFQWQNFRVALWRWDRQSLTEMSTSFIFWG